MNLEESIKLTVENKLKDGSIEKMVSDYVEKGISESLKELFGWSGDARKVIEGQIKSVMVPYLENYDYSQYIVKLDSVLTDVLNKVTGDNRKLLSNFKELMATDVEIREAKISDVFKKWCDYVSKNVETDELEVTYDDGPSYESVEVSYEFEETEERSWLKQEKGRIIFECEHDEKMNICIDVYRWDDIHKKNQWSFSVDDNCNLNSLRHIDEFKLYLMALKQANVDIEIDKTYDNENVYPEKEPEAYYE